MIITNDILAPERRGLITASKVSVLFPKKSAEVGQRSYAKFLANEMFWGYSDTSGTWQTEHGNMNEHHAEQHYMTLYGEFGERPEFIMDEENQLGGSPDWIGIDHGCDWKCPTTLQGWLDYLHEGIDDQQFYQAQMYMALTGLTKWKICAYLTETLKMIDSGQEYPVPQENRMIICEVDYQPGFKEQLIERAPKIIQMRDQFLMTLHNTFSGRAATEEERHDALKFDLDNEPEFISEPE